VPEAWGGDVVCVPSPQKPRKYPEPARDDHPCGGCQGAQSQPGPPRQRYGHRVETG
jgi:hypothetical protein